MNNETKTDEKLFNELAESIVHLNNFAPYGLVRIIFGSGVDEAARSLCTKLQTALTAIQILEQ